MMKTSRASIRHCVISALAVIGSFVGWHFWFVSGGWQRDWHWVEGTVWAASISVGIWAGVNAIRIARHEGADGASIAAFSTILICLHTLSFLLFWMFVSMLAQGGPHP